MLNEFNKRYFFSLVFISMKLLFLSRLVLFDTTWRLFVIALISHANIFYASLTLPHSSSYMKTPTWLVSSSSSSFSFLPFLLFATNFCTLFILQTVLRYVHVLYIYFIYDTHVFHYIQCFCLKQTQIVNISWMLNQVFVSSLFVIRFSTYVCTYVHACLLLFFFIHSFFLECKRFSKAILFAFSWFYFF